MGGALLVLGGNAMARPAVAHLVHLGYEVVVADGNPEAPARDAASRFVCVNFFDTAATLQAIESIDLSGVMPLNDFGVRTAAAVAHARGLRGWSRAAAINLTNKVAMKNAWLEHGLPSAPFTHGRRDDLLAGVHPAGWDIFPAVVKPAFAGGGSRGVRLARDWDEVRRWVAADAAVYRDDEVVIEAYVQGTEHTLEVLVDEGRTRVLSISDKQNYADSMSIVQNLYFPGPVGSRHRAELEELVAAACRALGLEHGAAHFEVLIVEGKAMLLEVGGRPGGGLNFDPICRLSTGYDYPALLAAILTGGHPDFTSGPTTHLAWHYFDVGSGFVSAIHGFEEVVLDESVVHAEMNQSAGQQAKELRDDLARPGYVLVRGTSHEEARGKARMLIDRVRFVTEPVKSR